MTVQEQIAAPAEQKVWQVRVKDFLLLAGSGAFADHARTELLDGEIWVVNAIHSRHAAAQAELHGLLWQALRAIGSDLRTYVTPSVEIGDRSLPEPDIAIAEPHGDGFLPFGKVRLVIELSDTTLDIDLGRKLHLYAAAGIPEYWAIEVNEAIIHQMWAPAGDIYTERSKLSFGDKLKSRTVDMLEVDTAGLSSGRKGVTHAAD